MSKCFHFDFLVVYVFHTPTAKDRSADFLQLICGGILGLYWHHICVSGGKKPWYHDKPPQWSNIDQKDAHAILPEGAHIWVGRVVGEWKGHCPPYRRIISRWSLSSQEGAMKNIVQRLWTQALHKAGLTYCTETCPHSDYFADAPPH